MNRTGRLAAGQSGFTLVELLVALALGALLASLAAQLGGHALRVERAQAEQAGLTTALRTGLAYLTHELEALGADSVSGADLDSAGAGIGFRAQRGLRVTCRLVPDTVVVHADTALDWSVRGPVPGRDSLLLYAPGDGAQVVDAWDPIPILSVAPGRCPGGLPGLALGTVLDSSRIATRRHTGRTVARVFERVAVAAYAGAGGWQLGQVPISGGGVIQPLSGALQPAGLSAAGQTRAGGAVGLGPATWLVRLGLRGRTDRQLAPGMASRSNPASDSAGTVVFLRNLP